MVAGSKGMVQVSGTTYRIVEKSSIHEIVRILDDRVVGAFRVGPVLELIRSEIPRDLSLAIARRARRSAQLSWSPPRASLRSRLWAFFQHAWVVRPQTIAALSP